VEVSGEFWISRLDPGTKVLPQVGTPFFSLSCTPEEVSVVGPEPIAGAQIVGPWRAFRVAGVLDFSLIGVLHGLTAPLAQAEISVFAQSTFDTDYLLIAKESRAEAVRAWTAAGHRVVDSTT